MEQIELSNIKKYNELMQQNLWVNVRSENVDRLRRYGSAGAKGVDQLRLYQ